MNSSIRSNRKPLVTKTITSARELEASSEQWWALWRRCPDSTPFQSPGWLIPWWRYFERGELVSLALLSQGCLVGLAPLYISQTEPGSIRKLQLLGTGISDYLDVLIEPSFRQEGIEAMAEFLQTQANWDECRLDQLRAGSPLLDEAGLKAFHSEVSGGEICPRLTLPSCFEDLDQVVPKAMLANIRYYRRRLQKGPPWWYDEATPENFRELFDALIGLHQARWADRGQAGVLGAAELPQFHRTAALELMRNGILRLYGLRIGQDMVAALYAFSSQSITSFYLSGFDPKWAAVSPGALLIAHAIEQAVREQHRYFDFLRGNERYKYMWGAVNQPTWQRRLYHGDPAG
ncbi:MAG TPA: GNAT family N-acetyltransferase [Candidatus Dormibacteraeota bacterium]|nr:GNAT family N-acetyltransferase [Candidatus Dormibacteraeota bacterium]